MTGDKQVDKSHYAFGSYIDHARFNSYFHQLRLIHGLKPRSVFEVGTGANVLRALLGSSIEYCSLDLDPELDPDVVGALPHIPIADKSFDVVCCFQVLEHLPFDLFPDCIAELARVSKGDIIVSVPYSRFRFQVALNLPRLKWRRLSITIPHFYRTHTFNGEHYWVVGTRGYSLKRVVGVVSHHCDVTSVSSPFEKLEHVFLTLRTRDANGRPK